MAEQKAYHEHSARWSAQIEEEQKKRQQCYTVEELENHPPIFFQFVPKCNECDYSVAGSIDLAAHFGGPTVPMYHQNWVGRKCWDCIEKSPFRGLLDIVPERKCRLCFEEFGRKIMWQQRGAMGEMCYYCYFKRQLKQDQSLGKLHKYQFVWGEEQGKRKFEERRRQDSASRCYCLKDGTAIYFLHSDVPKNESYQLIQGKGCFKRAQVVFPKAVVHAPSTAIVQFQRAPGYDTDRQQQQEPKSEPYIRNRHRLRVAPGLRTEMPPPW